MKKFKLICFLLGLIHFRTHAQFGRTISTYGLRGALNFDLLSTKPFGNTTSNFVHLGITAGAICEAQIYRHFYIESELNYSFKGGASLFGPSDNVLLPSINHDENLSYINIPFLFKLKGPRKGIMGYYTGPEFGYLIAAKQSVVVDYTETTNNVKPYFKDFDLDLDFGINIRFSHGLGMDIRYSYGLINIVKPGIPTLVTNPKTGVQTTTDAKLVNNNFQLGLYYKFSGW